MKKNQPLRIAVAFIASLMPLVVSAQTTFFSDNFTSGSTLNSATPANATNNNAAFVNSTAYEMVASKSWSPAPTMTANDLKMGIAATSSGYVQAQALFATNAVALTQTGDYIRLTVAFTNTTGLLTTAGQLGIGLFNSGQVKPVAGGINNSAPTTFTGFAQGWVGYASDLNFSGATSRILTRPAQTLATLQNQDLVTFGTSSSYVSAVIGTATGDATLVAGSNYTEVLTITLNDVNSLAITNTLYNAGGIMLTNFGAIATNTTFLTGGFDALAIGYCGRSTSGGAPLIHVSSIKVDGSVSIITGPPTITVQPVPVTVATGGACAISVAATGFSMTYQWHRHGTNLTDNGNISGSTSSQLVITSASAADAQSGANGYYVTVFGAGGYSTNSATNSLTLVTANNLYYSGNGAWDLNTSQSWNTDDAGDQSNFFNFGDSVTFDDGGGGGTVSLSGNYLSAASVTVSHTGAPYTWTGSGNFAGPGKLIYNGSGQLNVNNANTFTGGTTISNAAANLHLGNANGLGTGPVKLALAGGKLEWTVGGSATAGLGDVVVADDFTMQFDTFSTFSGVILGNLSGTAGKTLTLTLSPYTGNTITNERVRVYGSNTVCNANIAFDSGGNNLMSLAPYNSSGTQTYNGVISGDGSIWQRGSASSLLNGDNTYSGGTYTTAGGIGFGIDSTPTVGTVTSGPIGTGPLYISPENGSASGSGTVFASGGARTIANALQYSTNNQVLIVGGTNALTFSGAYSLKGNDGLVTNRTFQVNNTNTWTTISGVIDDASSGCGFIKTGTGTLALNNTETYSGLTTVSAGTLAGNGSIGGSVLVTTNASIGGGAATGIGTLTIGGNLSLTNGGGFFRLNRNGGSPISDQVSVSGGITNTGIGTVTGTITVTNLGVALQTGDSFTLFNKAVVGGATLTITGGGATWTNKLAVNGTIVVIPSVNTTPTNIVSSVSGNTLTLSWPADHTGWRLIAQTNTLSSGLKAATNNWFTVPNSTTVNSMSIPINPANATVFYRLVYP